MLPEAALARLGAAMTHRTYAKGSLIISVGETLNHLMVVARGRLNLVHVLGSGRVQVVRALMPGDFIGEMALFAPTQAEGNLVAVEDSQVCLVPRTVVQSLLADYPDTAARLVAVLAARLQAAEQLIGDLGLRDVGQRLAAELLRLAPRSDEDDMASTSPGQTPLPARDTVLRMPVPWSELATRLGTTPESLSRRLRDFAAKGFIRQLDPRTIVLTNPAGLNTLADGDS